MTKKELEQHLAAIKHKRHLAAVKANQAWQKKYGKGSKHYKERLKWAKMGGRKKQ